MSLIYITGISGMGKSTVLKELRQRNFEAYGVDEDSFGWWRDRETGQPGDIDRARKTKDFDIQDWYKKYSWHLDAAKIRILADQAVGKTVFLCGTANDYDENKQYFDTAIAVHIDDPESLIDRISTRTDVYFGKDPEDLKRILEWQKTGGEYYARLGMRIVDSSRPVTKVVDEILQIAGLDSTN